MKVNIFKIPLNNLPWMLKKFSEEKVKLLLKHTEQNWDWKCDFFLSENPEIKEIPWVKYYDTILWDDVIENKVYFAVYLCSKWDDVFAITYWKSHFYVRNYCDSDFGLNMAKRIANEKDVKQIASKRFAWKKKKEIKSFTKNTKLDNESWESIDYINSSIIEEKQSYFGNNSKFGASLLVSREDLLVSNITELLDEISRTLLEESRFEIPKTEEIKNKDDIKLYNNELISKFNKVEDENNVETTLDSHDIVWVDFVFSWNEKYIINYFGVKSDEVDSITIDLIRKFINENNIDINHLFDISIKVIKEDQKTYSKKLKDFIEYTIEDKNIIFQYWKWIKFNEEYIDQINTSVDSIEIDVTETEFEEIKIWETEFNNPSINTNLTKYSYISSDKDFSKLKIKWSTNIKVEAWDLQKWDTVYAVKFWTPQKLVYVCNQAINTLEIIRNKSNLKKLSNSPKKYCLWLWFDNKNTINLISEVNSIILKQQIDIFSRKCREIWIEPMLKFSKRVK